MRTLLVAIPMFGNRVAPRWGNSKEMLVARVVDGRVVMKKVTPTIDMSERQRLALIADMGVTTLVCSGVEPGFRESAVEAGMEVIDNVAGEVNDVLKKIAAGELHSWYGYSSAGTIGIEDERLIVRSEADTPPRNISRLPSCVSGEKLSGLPDCTRCASLECLEGKDCLDVSAESARVVSAEPAKHECRIGSYVSSDCLGTMCRVEEMIEYCAGMEYRTVGIAFCMDLTDEARTLTGLFRRKFDVVAVGCKVGGIDKAALELPRTTSDTFEAACNPAGQAIVLKRYNCDIAVCVGLCIGADIILQRTLTAPVTSLIVKDRLLANNPSAALFSKFHLRNITGAL